MRTANQNPRAEQTASALAELVEYLGRHVQQSCFTGGLKPAQWSVLRYLARANPTARTVSGVAAAMLTTNSTASQTIRVLRHKGLVEATRNLTDARVVNLALTAKGKRLLDTDPLRPLVETLNELPSEELSTAKRIIAMLIRGTVWRADDASRAPNRPSKSESSARSLRRAPYIHSRSPRFSSSV